MIYPTKVDAWIRIMAPLSVVLPVGVGMHVVTSGNAQTTYGWHLIFSSLLLFSMPYFQFWPVTYDPGASSADGEPILLVRCGCYLRWEIPIGEIREVRPSRNSASGPAWSLDRLEVVASSPSVWPGSPSGWWHNSLLISPSGSRASLLISPKDRDGFLDELARRAGDLERNGDRLLRRVEAATAH